MPEDPKGTPPTPEAVEPVEPAAELKLPPEWNLELQAAVCEHCDWAYLFSRDKPLQRCPHCFQPRLSKLDRQIEELPFTYPPEQVIPFAVPSATLERNLLDFARRIWFAPADLKPSNLTTRLQRVYLPLWLVDTDVQAVWQAEAGFNYEVVSHRERFDQNRAGWVTREVEETRIRWEPRAGKLHRSYSNVPAPALEEDIQIRKRLGTYDSTAARAYESGVILESSVRLPDRSPEDAWPSAVPALQSAAAEECRQAAAADHIRQFRWSPDYVKRNWTLMLLPMYTTYYLDDQNDPKVILIHGQSGRVTGERRASMRRAQRTSLIFLIVALVIFVIGLLVAAASLVSPDLLVYGGIGILLALFIALLAVVPIGMAWSFNRSQSKL
jgi:hypothetical protein